MLTLLSLLLLVFHHLYYLCLLLRRSVITTLSPFLPSHALAAYPAFYCPMFCCWVSFVIWMQVVSWEKTLQEGG